MKRKTELLLAALLILTTAGAVETTAKESHKNKTAKARVKTDEGEQVYHTNCASCHSDGSNKVNPNKPLAGSAKLDSIVTFKDFLNTPPTHMPYYQHIVKDPKAVEALYNYCKKLKKTGPTAMAQPGQEKS